MEPENLPPEEIASSVAGCASCGHPIIEQGHATALCKECREKFIKFPIPPAIKIFAGLILVIFVFAMIRTPQNLSAGIHYQRAKDDIRQGRYLSAENELNKVVRQIPRFISAKEYLAIASFHNQDFRTFTGVISELQGKTVEEQELYSEINEMINKFGNYVPSDSFMVLYTRYHSFDSIPEEINRQYVIRYPDEVFAAARYASILLNNKEYQPADSVTNILLQKDNSYLSGLGLKTAIKRDLKQFDSAHYYCDRILSLNQESTYGMSLKARVFLKEKKDAEGLQWALKSVALDKEDGYSIATLALAYHFNNKPVETEKILHAVKKDSSLAEYIQYASDIINGKEKFRD